jgi:hypothetical protein
MRRNLAIGPGIGEGPQSGDFVEKSTIKIRK